MADLVKFKYWCFTDGCWVKELREGYIIEKEEDKVEEVEKCPGCGEPLKQCGRIVYGGFLKFNSLSSSQKQQVLKKRSDEHFKKTTEEKFHELNRKKEI